MTNKKTPDSAASGLCCIVIDGVRHGVPKAVADLLESVSRERDDLVDLAREVCEVRTRYIVPVTYHIKMERICVKAHRATLQHNV